VADEEENAGNHTENVMEIVMKKIQEMNAATERWHQYLAAKYPKTGFPQGSAALPQLGH
jgi:hypothetical protein